MKEQFVPRDLSLKLQKLGFDWDCLCVYNYYGKLKSIIGSSTSEEADDYCSKEKRDDRVPAPLWQQAFDWFRDKKGYSSVVTFNGSETYYWWIIETRPFGLDCNSIDEHSFNTYESARQSCLEKLISIVEHSKPSHL